MVMGSGTNAKSAMATADWSPAAGAPVAAEASAPDEELELSSPLVAAATSAAIETPAVTTIADTKAALGSDAMERVHSSAGVHAGHTPCCGPVRRCSGRP